MLTLESSDVEKRKIDHLRIALNSDVRSRRFSSQFDQVTLIHEALPSVGLVDVHTEVSVLGKKLAAPIIVGAMTGGARGTDTINGNIAEAVEELGLGMGVGSERPALKFPHLEYTYSVIRKKAPNALVLANIGASNAGKLDLRDVRRAVELVQADGLEIHLNMLQELVQPEGEPDFKGLEDKIDEICDEVRVPVLVKETGSGISMETALRLRDKKVAGFDVGGSGGTSFAIIEGKRRKDELADAFADWGIPTLASVMEVRSVTQKLVIASGGLRNGVDAAKAIALGADLVSFARPVLQRAVRSSTEVKEFIRSLELQLRMAMVLTNSRDVASLRKARFVLTGELLDWATQRRLLSRRGPRDFLLLDLMRLVNPICP